MSADDQVAVILAGLDSPVAPRPQFADALLARLLEELAEAQSPAARGWPVAFRMPRILPHAPPRPRLALIAIAVFLLLAGIATATYLGVRAWTSAGPRGVQYTNDFQLVALARGVDYHHLAISPDGETLYALSVPTKGKGRSLEPDIRRAALVEVSDLGSDHVRRRVVLNLNDLKRDRALWDAGVDLRGSVVPQQFTAPEFKAKPSVAPNGDVAFVASLSPATSIDQFFRRPPLATSLLVRHRSGNVEKVVTVRELVRAALLEPAALGPNRYFTVAFSSPHRLFLYVNDEPGRDRFRRFFEIVDPDADGNWSNREIRPLELPPFLGLDRPGRRDLKAWYVNALAAEPSLAGEDRTRSFLLLLRRWPRENRVYRISDRDADGDARDRGEFELVFAGRPGRWAEFEGGLAPRTVVSDGEVAFRELIVGGFTSRTRVSRITEGGRVIDVARAFSRIEDVAASPNGRIYVLADAPDAVVPTLYALVPASPGRNATPKTRPANEPSGPATSGAPLPDHTLAVTRTLGPIGGPYSQSIFFLGSSGRRLRTLVSGGNATLGPESPSADWIIYWADRAVPNETYTYAANLHTGRSRLLARNVLQPLCWLSETTALLEDSGSMPIRVDVRSGARKPVEQHGRPGVAHLQCTADGRRLLLLTRSDRQLELLDLATGKRRGLGPPLPHGSTYGDAQLAPDGRHLAYTIERPAHARVPESRAYIRATATGRTTLVRRAPGRMYVLWSPAGDHLLLRTTSDPHAQAWNLFLVDTEQPTAPRLVASSPKYVEHLWAPDGSAFAYTTGAAVRVARVGGTTRTFAATAGYKPFGWSPDGRYLGLVRQGRARIALVDTTTGAIRTVLREQRPHTYLYVAWLR